MKVGAACMWASCCGRLLNELMGTGAVRGQQAGFGGGAGPFRFAPSAGYSTFPASSSSTSTLLCQACRQAFSVFRRRHMCCDCKKSFCSLCSVLQENLRRCTTCHLLWGTAFQRSRLMHLRVRDLRLYLTLHNINTDTCREKDDLVDLVLCHQGAESEDDPDTPTLQSQPLYTETPPTEGPASRLSPSHEEPIGRSDGSGSTNQDVGDNTPLINLEPAEQPPQGRRTAPVSLSDLSSLEDVEQLTVRQLKEILARNFVSFSGCCEKWELVERVRRLYRESEGNHKSNGGPQFAGDDDGVCRICMDGAIDCVLLECGHMITCTKCGKRMSECPICRQYVVRAVHVFRS